MCQNWRHAALHMPGLHEMSSQSLGEKGKWVYCKHLYYVFRILCKMDYDSEKFIHPPMYPYNEVMRLLELAGVVECEQYFKCCIHFMFE